MISCMLDAWLSEHPALDVDSCNAKLLMAVMSMLLATSIATCRGPLAKAWPGWACSWAELRQHLKAALQLH